MRIQLNMNERARHAAALHVGGQDMEKVQGTIKQFVRDWSAGVRKITPRYLMRE